jgi:hypothetical protein
MDNWKEGEKSATEIVFKDASIPNFNSDKNKRYVTCTMDFVFIYDFDTESYTAYPMSEICSIKSKGEVKPKYKRSTT